MDFVGIRTKNAENFFIFTYYYTMFCRLNQFKS